MGENGYLEVSCWWGAEEKFVAQSSFWRWYLLASLASACLSVLLFHLFDQMWHEAYETSAVWAGLLTLPINWLAGEQLTWAYSRSDRLVRATHYYLVYGTGLALDVGVVHVVGHLLHADLRIADAIGIVIAMGWTAPMNRFVTWRADLVALPRVKKQRN